MQQQTRSNVHRCAWSYRTLQRHHFLSAAGPGPGPSPKSCSVQQLPRLTTPKMATVAMHARHEREERKRVGPTPTPRTEPPKQLVTSPRLGSYVRPLWSTTVAVAVPERKICFRQNLPPFYFWFCCHLVPPSAESWAGQGQQRGPSSLKHADLACSEWFDSVEFS